MKRTTEIAGLVVLLSLHISAQTEPVIRFEVASVKVTPRSISTGLQRGCHGGPGTSDPGTVVCNNEPLKAFVLRAFQLKDYQVAGPDWMTTDLRRNPDLYSVTGKLAADTTPAQVASMWQQLLIERFGLTYHRETRELPIYALIAGKGGAKLTPAEDATSGPPPAGGAVGGRGSSASGASAGANGAAMNRIAARRMSLSGFADSLTRSVDRPVIDQTGLTGNYRIELAWDDLNGGSNAADGFAPTLAEALQEQLGLRLEARKSRIEVLVIDRIEKVPTGN